MHLYPGERREGGRGGREEGGEREEGGRGGGRREGGGRIQTQHVDAHTGCTEAITISYQKNMQHSER